jgi:hypothetical protein
VSEEKNIGDRSVTERSEVILEKVPEGDLAWKSESPEERNGVDGR